MFLAHGPEGQLERFCVVMWIDWSWLTQVDGLCSVLDQCLPGDVPSYDKWQECKRENQSMPTYEILTSCPHSIGRNESHVQA